MCQIRNEPRRRDSRLALQRGAPVGTAAVSTGESWTIRVSRAGSAKCTVETTKVRAPGLSKYSKILMASRPMLLAVDEGHESGIARRG